jgi:dolichyl-phosphate beta-glucosyltransferase
MVKALAQKGLVRRSPRQHFPQLKPQHSAGLATSRSLPEPPFLSVVIPAFNEAERLPPTLAVFLEYLRSQDYGWEIIVVDDGSTDRTAAAVMAIAAAQTPVSMPELGQHSLDASAINNPEPSAKLTPQPKATIGQIKVIKLSQNQGKGSAVKAGVLASRGKQVLFSDADGSTPLSELGKLQAQLASGYQIAIGTRSNQALVSKRQPLYRTILGEGFNWLARLAIGAHIQDTQCGFKLLDGDRCRSLFAQMQIPGFGFDVELLYLAHKGGDAIAQIPVVWHNDTRSKVNVFRDPVLMFIDLIRIRLMH